MRKTKTSGTLIFSPSDLTAYLESPFSSWMDRFALEFPGEIESDAEDEAAELIQTKGMDHEKNVLEALKKEFKDVATIDAEGNFESRHAATLIAMQKGAAVIYQAALKRDSFLGYADFLVKVSGRSKLGDFHYEAWDSKLARSTKPYFVIQLLAYSEMLESIQGVFPQSITVVLGTGERKALRTNDFSSYYFSLKKRFLEFHNSFDRNQRPRIQKNEEIRNWSEYAAQLIVETDDLSQVANIKTSQQRKLERAGITTLTALAGTKLKQIPNLEAATLAKLKRQARLQLESRGLKKPKYEILDHQEDQRTGLRLLPPPSSGDVYFDMEGYPLFEDQGLEYLFGAIYLDKNKDQQFIDFWAHNRANEKKAFEGWIDWVYPRFRADPAMHIYHYAAYEVTAMRKLSTQHATREFEVDQLLRAETFVDLFKIVSQSIVVGEANYSIKSIEHLYAQKRDGDVKKASDSIVEYAKYLMSPDGATWETSKILKGIRDYNEIDCISTLKLTDWLRDVQKEAKLHFVSAQKEGEEAAPPESSEAAQMAEQLLLELDGKIELTEDERVQKLLAELIEFHRREAKQYWWKYFDWLTHTHEELTQESDCIGDIQRTAKKPSPDKRSLIAEYRFDPSQEVKFRNESECRLFIDQDRVIGAAIGEIDREMGTLTIRMSAKKVDEIGGFPAQASILPGFPVDTGVISDSIFAIVSEFGKTKTRKSLPSALADLLYRSYPRITGHKAGGTLPLDKADLTKSTTALIQKMEQSTICIQGPPGAGKTYTGSHVILALLKEGKRVGVTSNSHHAIENLMAAVMDKAITAKLKVTAYKTKSDNEEFFEKTGVAAFKSADIGAISPAPNGHILVGGTAWTFSRDEAVDALDYLFVDEAGQVALANLVGMSRSAKNIVLLGDQRQLEQPIQGAHPGESGESCLNYLIQNHATIPAELGIFLAKTFRMRPAVCEFISNNFYEGRLESDESTLENELLLDKKATLVTADEGILFLPIDHEDCSQSSLEEVALIKSLIEDLLKSKISENGKVRALTASDLLVVAPYNLQMGLLKDALPKDIAVGSVDKFQGKEAPVVILSMCSSNLELSPRGVEFLFNPNRLNVALSRAKCLAIVVGNPALQTTAANSIEKMKMVNLYCAIAGGRS